MSVPPDLAIRHPFPEPPAPGRTREVAPGILWARLPLPFRLDHVNVYALEDGDGWMIVDTGIDDRPSRTAWATLLAGPLAGRPVTRVLATHAHPDHVGLADWLVRSTGAPLLMSETEYLSALVIRLDPGALQDEPYRSFYLDQGLEPDLAQSVLGRGHDYLRMLSGLPRTFRRIGAGDVLTIGGRRWTVLTGGGHSPEGAMLHAPADGLFLSADQVLPRITPNVGAWPRNPEGDPLDLFLRSLAALKEAVAADALVLPGHDLPFTGLHRRIDALAAHHRERCDRLVEACRTQAHLVAELIPVLFHRPLDAHGTGFAFAEALAHVNYLLGRGELVRAGDGSRRVRAA